MKEHRKEVELHEGKKYTRSTRKQSQSEQNKSAITDHVNTENHIIDWEEATLLLAGNLIGQHCVSEMLSKSGRKPKTS